MTSIAVIVGDETPRRSRTEAESTALRHRDLADVLADFDARGVGLRSSDNLTRDDLYDDATRGHGAPR